jgi:hypothetical protein
VLAVEVVDERGQGLPLPSTVLLPPVWVRRMVGIRTSMAMDVRFSSIGLGAAEQRSCGLSGPTPIVVRDSDAGRPSCRGPPRGLRAVGVRRVLRQS